MPDPAMVLASGHGHGHGTLLIAGMAVLGIAVIVLGWMYYAARVRASRVRDSNEEKS